MSLKSCRNLGVQFDYCQVEARTKHFWRTLPPSSFLAVNRREWEEMHDRLNGGVPVPKETKTSAICQFAVASSAVHFGRICVRQSTFFSSGFSKMFSLVQEQQLPYFFEEIPAWC